MKKIFFYALTGAVLSVATNASAQSTVTNVAAPTAKQAGGVAPKQINDNSGGRGSAANQSQSAAAAAPATRSSRATTTAKANNRAMTENAKTDLAKPPADAPATKTK